MRSRMLLGALAVASASAAFSNAASAEPYHHRYYRSDVSYGTLSAQFDYGIWTGDGDTNLYGPGIGVRGGFTLSPGVYLGADFDYFFGHSVDAGGPAGSGSSRVNVYDFMGEVGYDFWAHGNGILRPKLGIGVGIAKASGCAQVNGIGGGCVVSSESGLALAPGLQYIHFFDTLFLTLEARYQTVSIDGPDPSAVVLGAGLGFGF